MGGWCLRVKPDVFEGLEVGRAGEGLSGTRRDGGDGVDGIEGWRAVPVVICDCKRTQKRNYDQNSKPRKSDMIMGYFWDIVNDQ